jgi:hypothetical protein
MVGSELPEEVPFHVHLAMLHKIELSKDAMQLLGGKRAKEKVDSEPNETPDKKVFLHEVSQLADKNQTRNAVFRRDLSDFVGLHAPLDPLPMTHKDHRDHKKEAAIAICDDEFVQLRSELASSSWKWEFPHSNGFASVFWIIPMSWCRHESDSRRFS